jgi:DegV family protein with EDD domain
MALRIVTDSTCDLPKSFITEMGVTVLPCNLHIGDKTLLDGIDITSEEFYKRLAQGGPAPTTSQPSVGAFLDAYNKIGRPGDEILSLHISAKLSGTYNSAFQAAKEAQTKAKIEVVDGMTVSLGLGILVREVATMAKRGATLAQAKVFLSKEIPNITCYCSVDTLEYLVRGGRASRVQGFFGSLLDIKPIISVRDGEVHPVDRVRTRKRMLARLVEMAGEAKGLRALGVMHSACEDEAEALADQLGQYFPRNEILIREFTPVMGAHLGPRAIGMGMWKGGAA